MDNLTHAHEVIDKDLPFVIDPITLAVSEQSLPGQPASLTVPQHSKNSQRLTFTIPDRYIEGHDMSEVNQTLIHFRNIDPVSGAISAGIYKVQDLAVSDGSVTLSWLIGDDATYYVGGLIFSIHFSCLDNAGNVAYNLPTLAYAKLSVGETIWNSEYIPKKYPDIIAELEGRISALEANSGGTGGGGSGFAGNLETWEIVVSGSTVTLNYVLEGDDAHTDVMVFDADGYPVTITHDGHEATGTWRSE